MFKRGLTIAMSLWLTAFAFYTPAEAQIEKVRLHLDAFLCGNVCANEVRSVTNFYKEEIEDVNINHKKHQVTLFPNPEKRLDLYDIRKELRNAGRIPWKIEVTVTGEVVDYTKTYSGGHLHPRRALKVKETGQQFLLIEGEQLDKLLVFVKEGHEKVTISGEIPAFDEKYLPVLVIKAFKATKKDGKKTGKAEGLFKYETVAIGGMQCQGCAQRVTNVLESVQGVQEAVVSLDEENAFVKYDSQKTRRSQLEAAIKEAGFTVE